MNRVCGFQILRLAEFGRMSSLALTFSGRCLISPSGFSLIFEFCLVPLSAKSALCPLDGSAVNVADFPNKLTIFVCVYTQLHFLICNLVAV